jgi:hypothetical protein
VRARSLAGLAAMAAAGCALHRDAMDVPWPRLGPERLRVAYEDPRPADKRLLFERINRDRLRHGVPALAWEPRAALVGDRFCLDNALTGAAGHWDTEGRAPYLRWGLAGGVDYHGQNAAAWTLAVEPLDRPVGDMLLSSHEAMMAETPPHDGHRRLLLDPDFTHLGIGLAVVGRQLRLSEEFTRVGFEWLAAPPRPVPAGSVVTVAGRPFPGWRVGVVEVRFEPPPRPLSILEISARGSYGYPPAVRTLHPDAGGQELQVRHGGELRLRVALDHGPGHYFVLCYLRRPEDGAKPMTPATSLMVSAV